MGARDDARGALRERRRAPAASLSGLVIASLLSLTAVLLLVAAGSAVAGYIGRWNERARLAAASRAPPWRPAPVAALAAAPPAEACGALVAEWMAASDARRAARRAAPPPRLTYFLHVPRTAGRTTYFCALKPAFAPSERCPRAYDRLRLNASAPACALLSSHDDFRLAESLAPAGGAAAVVTQVRHPLARVLSAYEFAVEVAARGHGRRDRKHVRDVAHATAGPEGTTETTTVWPWAQLARLVTEDMEARAAAARKGTLREQKGSGYNCSLVMPLHEFVTHPVVSDLLHDGATFQILGLTANTVPDAPGADEATAAALRACARAGGAPAAALVAAAAARLEEDMRAVLLTERLHDSVALLAATLGRRLTGRAYRAMRNSEEDSWHAKIAAAGADHAKRAAAAAEADAAGSTNDSLGEAFQRCAERQRAKASGMRQRSYERLRFADRSVARFDRADVADDVADAIRAANALDVALHAKATALFEARWAAAAAEGKLQRLPPPLPPGAPV